MTDTPRTTRAALHDGTVVAIEVAAGLERELQDAQSQLKAWREVAEQLVQLAMDGTHLLDDQRAALAQLHRLKTEL
jgi:hypothetical protein